MGVTAMEGSAGPVGAHRTAPEPAEVKAMTGKDTSKSKLRFFPL